MQIRGAFKIFEPEYIGQKFFIVYISVKGTYLAYSCEQTVKEPSL